MREQRRRRLGKEPAATLVRHANGGMARIVKLKGGADAVKGRAETVAPEMPSAEEIAACWWLRDEELRVYSAEYARTGFQGGLQSYRVGTTPTYSAELRLFSRRTIEVPAEEG